MNQTTRTNLALAILMAALAHMAGGCANQTPQQKLYLARQSYIGTEQAVTKLVRAGVIKPGPTLDAIEAVRNEARDALTEADAKVGTLGFDFVMSRVESALGRFAQFYLEHRPQPDAPAEPGATLWTPQPSRSRLPVFRLSPDSLPALWRPSANFSPART